jgi:hypothetical protein
MIWKDKRHENMLTNMHHPPSEGYFHDEHGNTLKPVITQDCNQHMGYVDKSACMTHTLSADGHGSGSGNSSSTS